MKGTRHNGRSGKDGVYNPLHNDRRFDPEHSEHIDNERVRQNIYWDCYQGYTTMADRGKEDNFSFNQIVNREDSYGYEISQTIKLVADIKESTLYPILKKLEKAGYVTTYSAEYQGRKRKYYSITEAGKTQMAYLQGEWKSYRDTIDNIIEWRKKE